MAISVPEDFSDVLRGADLQARVLADDGTYPNNDTLPVLVYGQAVRRSIRSPARAVERVFRANGWTGAWRNGIFGYHHYHSTAHEVLGVTGGSATVQLGGPDGWTLDVSAGDVLILPAGVAHKNLGSDRDFRVVGAYPDGQDWDLLRRERVSKDGSEWKPYTVPIWTGKVVYLPMHGSVKRGEPGERPEADRNIERVSLPEADPLYGGEGPLREHWGAE